MRISILTLAELFQTYDICHGTAAPAADWNKSHVLWALCKQLRERLSIFKPKNIIYSTGINEQLLSPGEYKHFANICLTPIATPNPGLHTCKGVTPVPEESMQG